MIGPARSVVSWSAIAATLALAFIVAAAINRPPPNFAAPPIAMIRDGSGRSLWAIRLAARAHEIAVDALAAAPPPATSGGHAYQLWLATPQGPRSLGLLPQHGRTIIPEIPALVTRLAGGPTRLLVSREPLHGSPSIEPSGPIVFHATAAAAAAAGGG